MILKKNAAVKQSLHPRNIHKTAYNFTLLAKNHPEIAKYSYTLSDQTTIDFSDPQAVLHLNSALLKTYYQIEHWQIPAGYLCPPIPGRVDYIHYLADLLTKNNSGRDISTSKVTVLDIGTGASCIYPILGQRCYQWSFIASDIDPLSVNTAKHIINANKGLANRINIKLQSDPTKFFDTIIGANQKIELTMCNPPFHSSLQEALAGNKLKRKNLQKNSKNKAKKNVNALNFGGQQAELYCRGGELQFIKSMINESKRYSNQVLYFSTLVSKKDNLDSIKLSLKKAKAIDIQTIKMSQGNKISRFIAWSFLDQAQREAWCNIKFKQKT